MIQNNFHVDVIKTTKVNIDENAHSLPPYLGKYKEFKVADYFCPLDWSNDGTFIPVNEGDPIWFDFRGNADECAIICAIQRINPVTGEPANLEEGLSKEPSQNYLRMPEQMWIDGYAKDGKVYQFVITKAGVGLAVNEYLLPKHMQDSHALGFAFFAPKNPKPKIEFQYIPYSGIHHWNSHRMLDNDHQYDLLGSSGGMSNISDSNDLVYRSAVNHIGASFSCSSPIKTASVMRKANNTVCDLGENNSVECFINSVETVDILDQPTRIMQELEKASMGMGGRIKQSIVTDNNTVDYYNKERSALLTIYLALPEMFETIMNKGKRQDADKKDKYKTSGHIGRVAIPLI